MKTLEQLDEEVSNLRDVLIKMEENGLEDTDAYSDVLSDCFELSRARFSLRWALTKKPV